MVTCEAHLRMRHKPCRE